MGTWSQMFSEWAIRRSRWLLGFVVVMTVFFAVQALTLKINPSLFLLGKSHEGRVQMDRARTIFSGAGEQIFVGVVTQKDSIINTESLQTIEMITKQFSAMSLVEEGDTEKLKALDKDSTSQQMINAILVDGITRTDLSALKSFVTFSETNKNFKSQETEYLKNLVVRVSPVIKVRSLTEVENIRLKGESLDVHNLITKVPSEPAELKSLADEIAENKMFVDTLIAHDNKGSLVQIELSVDEEDSRNLQLMYEKVVDILNAIQTKDSFHIGGTATYYAAITDIVEKDNNKFFPFVILIMSLSLMFGMRSWQGVWLPLTVAIGSLIWTMGTISLLDFKLNIITNMIPVFLLSLATSDSIHFLSRYYLFSETQEKAAAVKKALSQQLVPMFLSSLCTFFGFATLAFTNLTFIFEFGIFVACGVIYAFFITICLLPGLVPYLTLPKNIHEKRKNGSLVKWVERVSMGMDSLTKQSPRAWLVGLILLCAGLVYTGSYIKVDNENIASFSESTRVRQDNDSLNQHFGGTVPISIWLESKDDDIVKSSELISALRLIQQRLQSHPEIGYTISPVDFLDRIHEVISGETNTKLPLDASNELISQYFLLYEFGDGSELKDLVDYTYRSARIVGLGYTDKGSVWQKIIKDIASYAPTVLPVGVTMHLVGTGELQASNIPEIINDQIFGFWLSAGLILIVMTFLMRSLSVGLIAMVPIFVCVLILGAFMVMLNIPLDIATSMIVGICFGVGIDYSIYYTSIFQQYITESQGDVEYALTHTMKRVAYPIFVNASSLGAGFAVLCMSSYAAISHLGLLVASAQFVSIACTLGLLPLLIRAFKPKFKFAISDASEFSVEAQNNLSH